MPPKDTFDTREKLRVLSRLALCWGIHITSEAFGIELSKYGISTARGKVE
jgi:hypothetical protein